MMEQRVRCAAIDAEGLRDGIDEAADARHGFGRQHEDDAADRDHVEEDAENAAAQHRERHVVLRVLHLLGGAVLQLEADVVEEQHRHETEEHGPRRREVGGAEAGDPVLDAVDDHRDREEAEDEDAHEGADVRDPLALTQRDDRDADRDPDEDELEEVVAERAVPDVEDVRAPGVGRDEGERAADPERVRDPVEDRRDTPVQSAEGELDPLVRATLHRERAPDLRHHEHVRRHEEQRERHEPEEALGAVRRDRAERVQPDECADREEDHVEPPQRFDELALLLLRERRRVDGV